MGHSNHLMPTMHTFAIAALFLPSVSAFTGTVSPLKAPMGVMRHKMTATAPAPGTATDVLKVGIVGCGRIGQVHLDTLGGISNVKPVIMADIPQAEELMKNLCDKYDVDGYTTDPMEVINHPDVDAVWICSPSQFHEEQIKAAAAAGKHVFCEKPLATDLEGTKAAVAAMEDAGMKLMTAFQRRFDPNFSAMEKAIADGEIGRPLQAILQSRDPAPPPFGYVKGGGGLFKDMAIHDLDIAQWLMSAAGPNPPVRVYATGSCNCDKAIEELKESNPSEAIDTAQIQITFEDGASATINVCRKATYGYDQRVEVFGTDGHLSFGNMAPTTVKKMSADGVSDLDKPYDFFMSRYKTAYTEETAGFAGMLTGAETEVPTGHSGLLALRMAMACDLSLKEGRAVDMSEI